MVTQWEQAAFIGILTILDERWELPREYKVGVCLGVLWRGGIVGW